MSVYELCQAIKDRIGEQAGGSDHGIYHPGQGLWLQNSKILEYYEIKSGDLLEFKKRHRPFKVRTLDGALKTIIIDETLAIQHLVEIVCDKWGILLILNNLFRPPKSRGIFSFA